MLDMPPVSICITLLVTLTYFKSSKTLVLNFMILAIPERIFFLNRAQSFRFLLDRLLRKKKHPRRRQTRNQSSYYFFVITFVIEMEHQQLMAFDISHFRQGFNYFCSVDADTFLLSNQKL